ncbi:MAG: hypothetical protein EVA79_06645 [Prochlorococcus sp. MED-G132]|nr:MAG: hypothetical protein EVA79_06645 [Prochlorococcus sp. MED-G132]
MASSASVAAYGRGLDDCIEDAMELMERCKQAIKQGWRAAPPQWLAVHRSINAAQTALEVKVERDDTPQSNR